MRMSAIAFAFAGALFAGLAGIAFPQPAAADDADLWQQYSSSGWSQHQRAFSRRRKATRSYQSHDEEQKPRQATRKSTKFKEKLEGGPRPEIAGLSPSTVRFASGYGRGTIVIDTSRRKLFYVLSKATAYQYPISVGRAGIQWNGTHKITRVQNWPNWRPPAEMRQRQPNLPVVMTGGLYNPLGAKALYLGSTLYRIHGTNNKKSIGRAASSGCFRMLNGHVTHLAKLAGVGTKVVVLKSLPTAIARSIKGRRSSDEG